MNLNKNIKIGIVGIIVALFGAGVLFFPGVIPAPQKAKATYQFFPTGGGIVTGTSKPAQGATAAAAEGVNMGDWRGTLADDNLHWGVSSTATGLNMYLDIGNVQLNGANKLIIQTEFDLDATAPATLVQICDWVSSVSTTAATDGQCTGGGWRNLNLADASITTATASSYDWEIYDGYWDKTATSSVSTPLTNFVDGNNKIRIRYFSSTNTTSAIHIDFLRVFAVVNPVYSPSSAQVITGGNITGNYANTIIGGVTQTGSGNAYFQVSSTASVISDFYFSFTGVETYTGANTILMRAEYGCSATGINLKPKIWNFNSSAWEDLTTGTIACSATDATNAWAKNNVTISNYVSGGEVRIGWYGSAVGAVALRVDLIYIMIGTTNTDEAMAEISFGSNSANSVTSTRNLDMTGVTSTWQILSADESNSQAFSQYAYDSDDDAIVEEAAAANIDFSVTPPANTAVTGIFFASRHMGGTTSTVQVGIKDYSGATSVAGGWDAVGAVGTTALTYTDNIAAAVVTSGGAAGFYTNPEDHIDTVNNEMNMRLRTTLSSATTANSIRQWDFAMVSIQWTEDSSHPTQSYQFLPTGGGIVTGTSKPAQGATAAAAEGVNMGDWRGTLADDNLHWGVSSTATGLNMYLDIGNVQLNGANKLIIQTEFDLDATAPATLVQICDWVSSVSTTAATDGQCTGGGWRNLNLADASITTATASSYDWEIYDGYWDKTATSSVSTPLTNFVDGNNKIRIRYFSSTNTTSAIHIDFLRVFAVVNPVYSPSSAQVITGGNITGNYANTIIGGVTQTGSDNAYFQVSSTASVISDFYFSFTGVETYTGANTILMRAEYGCSATGINLMPKIWNFNSSSWENLASSAIACSATDATNAWAKNNVTISNYVSGGEVRIGWYGSAVGAVALRVDLIYIMIGTTNTDGLSEISFGSNSANSVTATRDLDMTGVSTTWQILSADESNAQGFSQYAYDSDNNATLAEATAANIDFSVTPPANAAVTGIFFASRHMSGAAGTVGVGVKDYSGATNALGGWSGVGAGGTTALTYTDNIAAAAVTSGGAAGFYTNPEDHIDTVNNEMNMRLRTTTDGGTANNSVARWDFAMVSIQWTEVPAASSVSCSTNISSTAFGSLTTGSVSVAASNASTTMTCTGGLGCTLTVNDAGNGSNPGLATTSPAYLIPSANATLVAGTEGYGIQATTTATGNGGALNINSNYNVVGDNVGGLSTAAVTLASSTSAITGREVFVSHLAAISGTTQASSYSDTITYSCVGN